MATQWSRPKMVAEGVERFRELHSQLRVVILDMTMPVMSGEEALQHMRAIDSRVPAVLSSGYNEVEAIRRFAGKGLAGFIQKPYTAAALAAKIQSVLERSGGFRGEMVAYRASKQRADAS